VHLEANTKPHVYNLIHEFLINMAFTMACPNFKKGLKMVSRPLGVKGIKKPSRAHDKFSVTNVKKSPAHDHSHAQFNKVKTWAIN
jgi:hypothetical protein